MRRTDFKNNRGQTAYTITVISMAEAIIAMSKESTVASRGY
jgi:hypothetical protein